MSEGGREGGREGEREGQRKGGKMEREGKKSKCAQEWSHATIT